MKTNDDGLYLLRDGTYADPGACSKGDDGVLRHENGVAVALRDDGMPMTLGKTTEHNVAAAIAAGVPTAENETTITVPAKSAGRPAAANVPISPAAATSDEPKAD